MSIPEELSMYLMNDYAMMNLFMSSNQGLSAMSAISQFNPNKLKYFNIIKNHIEKVTVPKLKECNPNAFRDLDVPQYDPDMIKVSHFLFIEKKATTRKTTISYGLTIKQLNYVDSIKYYFTLSFSICNSNGESTGYKILKEDIIEVINEDLDVNNIIKIINTINKFTYMFMLK